MACQGGCLCGVWSGSDEGHEELEGSGQGQGRPGADQGADESPWLRPWARLAPMVAAMPAPRHQRARGGAGGSRPLSSTGQKRNSNGSNSEYSREVQQRRPVGPPYVCSDRAPSAAWGCWQAPDSRRCIDAGQPVTCANRPVIGPMTLVAWSRPGPPGGPFLPAAVAAFASAQAAALGILAGPFPSQEPCPLARAAFPDGRLGARAWRVVPMVSVRRWTRRCAAPLRHRVAPWRSPARLPAHWCVT
jgi:hypothetical protein